MRNPIDLVPSQRLSLSELMNEINSKVSHAIDLVGHPKLGVIVTQEARLQ